MKRKFTNVFFLVAIAVAAMTSFVSCKDYEDDLRTEFDANYQNLDQSMKDLRKDLEDRVSALEAFKTKQEGINADLQQQIDDLKDQIEALEECECDLTDVLRRGDLNGYATKAELEALQQKVDNINEVVKSHTTQIETLSGQLADGLARIQSLEDAISLIKSCECNLDEIAERINGLESRLENFVTKEQLVDSLVAVRATIAEQVLDLRNELSRVEAIAQAAYDLATADSARIDYVINLAKTDSVRIDELERAIQNINVEGYDDTALRTLITNIQTTLTGRISSLETLVSPIAGQIRDLQNQINAINQCNCNLTNLATKSELAAVEATANSALALAKQDSVRIDNLKDLYDALKLWADNLVIPNPQPGEEYDDQWIRDQFGADKDRMDVLGDSIKAVLGQLQPIRQSIADLESELREKIKSDSTYLKQLIDAIVVEPGTPATPYNDDWIRAYEAQLPELSNIPGLASKVGEIETAIADLPTIRENIADLTSDLQQAQEDLGVLEGALNDLTNVVDALNQKLNKLITSIVVQAVTNPLYGTFNTPFGISSNVLVTYYGENQNPAFKFPTTIEDVYYKKDQSIAVLTDVAVANNIKVQIGEGTLFDESEGNAGNLYLTVNPSNVDFTGTQFSLVNSRDEESPIKLGALQKSNRLIELGWSVTRADNGFYATPATISSDFAKAAPHIGLTEDNLKAVYEDLKPLKGNVSFKQIAKSVISAASEFAGLAQASAPAYGVKAAWTAGGEDYATYSKYEIAALAITPLSYSSANKLDEVNVFTKGIEVLENVINKIGATVQRQIKNQLKRMYFDLTYIDAIDFENITEQGFDAVITGEGTAQLPDLDAITITIPYSEIHEMYIIDPNGDPAYLETDGHRDITATSGAITYNGGNTATVHFSFDNPLSDTFSEMKNQFRNLDEFLQYLRGYLGDLNDLLHKMAGDNGYPGVANLLADKANEYVEKLANRFSRYTVPSEWLQPLAVAYDGSMKLLTGASIERPNVLNSTNSKLVLTSRSGELLAPAYKKWVAVTNAFNADGTPAAASVINAANQGEVNKVLPGSNRVVSLNLQKGYVYEISLQCVDYYGIVSAKKYYVKVK